jgi:hypothetical protein
MLTKEKTYCSLSEANSHFARTFSSACWSYLGKDERSADETAKMINLAHASLLHWSEGKECSPVNLQRGEFLVSIVYSFAERGEPAYYHAKRCLDLTFSQRESMMDFDIAYAYMAMARVLALKGLDDGAKEYLSKMMAAADQIGNNGDKQIFINDLGCRNWHNLTAVVEESINGYHHGKQI